MSATNKRDASGTPIFGEPNKLQKIIDERYPEMDVFMDESDCDVVFVIDGHKVPVHKQLLRLKSVVFRAMFSGHFVESSVKEIPLEDTTVDAFKTMIEFMYTERLVLTDGNDLKSIGDVLECGNKYQVIRLMDTIGNHLVKVMTIETMETIVDIVVKYTINSVMGLMCERLSALLTVDNVETVARIGYKYPIEQFVPLLESFLVNNFCQLFLKKREMVNELNAITNNLWLKVITNHFRYDTNLKKGHSQKLGQILRPNW